MRLRRAFRVGAVVATLLGGAAAGPARAPDLPPAAAKLTRLSGGRVQLALTNGSQEPMTAFAVYIELTLPGVAAPHPHSIRIVDSVLNPRDQEVMPGDTHRLTFGGVVGPGGVVSPPKVTLEAAVFADGSTFGDPSWVQRIIADRKTAYQNIGVAIRELQSAQASGETRQQLVARFAALKQQALRCCRQHYQGLIGSMPFDEVWFNLQHSTLLGRGPTPLRTLIPLAVHQLAQWRQRLYQAKPSVIGP